MKKINALAFSIDELEAMDAEDRLAASWEIPVGLLLLEDIEDAGFADFTASTPDSIDAEVIANKAAMRKGLHTAAIRETLLSLGIDSSIPLAKQVRTLSYAKLIARTLANEVSRDLGSLEIVDTVVVESRGRKSTKVRIDMAYGGTFWVFDAKTKAKAESKAKSKAKAKRNKSAR